MRLYRIHGKALGAHPEPARKTLRRWLGFIARSPQLLDRDRRLAWLWQLGIRVGRVEGSVKERVRYL